MRIMPPRLGEVIKHARQTRRLTLRRLADQVMKEDGTSISPQYLFDIEVHHRVPAPRVLRELARVLELEYDTLLALAGSADTVVREYLEAHPQHTAAVIQLFRAAQEQGFEDWDRLRQIITNSVKTGR
jgi:transcriptional regulator with XRE-family HTH domain